MIGPLVLLAAAAAVSAFGDAVRSIPPSPLLPGPPGKRTRWRMPTKPRRADPDKKRRRKARQAAQRRNRKH